ncbi:MAG: preprotein translocase subunit SecA [Candidatus Berkelbacteria bacterium Athens1014_28]|uniref:Protein translocase subunit SecA n=1 Tax=Candidatus Berkelbacteria bacterium Athens1014_28 TaxID=2017145 RepID=A0A554LQ15_9BACT|nr:MAG: preprotein translocase subunit SecA [Candidatus Berkelbacteria bacterium Athens1014_28]
MSLFSKFFSDSSNKVVSRYRGFIDAVNSFEEELKKKKDAELKKFTEKFRDQIKKVGGDKTQEDKILEEIMPEVFAVVREASRRVWGERHFDVQLIGGAVLHKGEIAEMKTGEGKTLVATLPLYLNALTGRGVHLVTVNDYLSKSQGEGMGEIYNFLGLSVGIIQNQQISYKFEKKKSYKHYSEVDGGNLIPCSRKEAYACDITYGTNNEFGFDYLRDNMAPNLEMCVQRDLNYAIVDEVDSILIDEARTPLIISAPAEESAALYQKFASLVPQLKVETDYTVDEKDRAVMITDDGIKKVEKLLAVENIYESASIALVHHLEEALKAHVLFRKDRDYVVRDGEIIIVDEFTGRLMVGRRYSEGLHQAIEAKENVEVKRESQTMATISFQNLFRLYKKLAGMTGTAATEAEEFYKIYKLDVTEIPTNVPMIRSDHPDKIYKSREGKLAAIVKEISERQNIGQPVLVGTISVEKNEELSKFLKRAGVKHEILNAKNHEREAKIIQKAGQRGAVTVATNMAGRGTDIKLGEGIADLGGLYVIGTERHESRRIDNQLRGRSGRQGDPGESQFFVSMDDDLMRIFGGERMKSLMGRLGLPEDMPIENKLVSRSIESAQKKVEGHNFDIRKHLVEYDDVMNSHRKYIYGKRRRILESEGIKDDILEMISSEIEGMFTALASEPEKIQKEVEAIFGQEIGKVVSVEKTIEFGKKLYDEREKKFGSDIMRQIERAVYLQHIDMLWVEHLTTMEEMRTGIGLQGYAQTDPLVAYKREAYRLFQDLLSAISSGVIRAIYRVEVQVQTPVVNRELDYQAPDANEIGDFGKDQNAKIKNQNDNSKIKSKLENSVGVTTTIRQKGTHPSLEATGGKKSVFDRMENQSAGENQPIHVGKKVGRNDPCPCGSGKKYKKCCGK